MLKTVVCGLFEYPYPGGVVVLADQSPLRLSVTGAGYGYDVISSRKRFDPRELTALVVSISTGGYLPLVPAPARVIIS